MALEKGRAGAGGPISGFVLYVAAVITAVMVLFPPFTGLGGTEYAFVLSGPEWSRSMGTVGASLGLTARIHWPALLVQLVALWAVAFGAKWFLGGGRDRPTAGPHPHRR